MSDHIIYLDHAATTPMKKEVLDAMLPWLTSEYGNASSLYPLGLRARAAVEQAREQVAEVIGAKADEIFFTSGGTEADNWALLTSAMKRKEEGNHIITTRIEHHAVLKSCAFLEKNGFRITYLPVPENGVADPKELEEAITDDTILISMMTANNEIGTVQPVRQIGELAAARGILFHTDAVQAYGHIPINVAEDHIDLLSASAHKIGGPKGVGLLYIRKDLSPEAFIHGGHQEKRMRAGTENVAGIVGFGKAAELIMDHMKKNTVQERSFRNQLITRILGEIPGTHLNGDRRQRLSNNVNIQFEGVDAEQLLLRLADHGICVSGGSACASGSILPSHVLTAIGCSHEAALESIRFTVGPDLTMQDIDETMRILKIEVEELRKIAGVKREFKGFINWSVPC